ncbi:MAG: hypothetical protein IKQ91_01015 [Oscillospiraceae bacterium]|nr:hypothetical protein [Oscillospiraceae bacterium]
MILIIVICLIVNIVKLAKAYENRSGSGLMPTGIGFTVLGILMLAGSLMAEPSSPDLDAFDVLFIIPMLIKVVFASLQGVPLTVSAVMLIGAGISDIICSVVLKKKYGRIKEGRRLTAAELAQKTETLESDYESGYLTKAEYEEQKRALQRRSGGSGF